MTVRQPDDQEIRRIEKLRVSFEECGEKPQFDVDTPVEMMLPSGDDFRLRTIIYRPAAEGSVPTVVTRSAYPQFEFVQRAKAEEYARRGFAYIFQYCRGLGGSEGKWEPNVYERDDGKAFLDWVCDQKWVKSVGYLGSSYLALTGWVIADIVPEKVKTMYLTHYGVFRHTSAWNDGSFRQDVLTSWTMGNAGVPIEADYEESCRFRPQIDVDEKMWGCHLDWYREWITNPGREDPCWNQGFWQQLKEIPPKVRIPLFLGEGWFDHHLKSALETYEALSEECRSRSTLCIGGWNHNFEKRLEGHRCHSFQNNDDARAFQWFWNILMEEKEPEGKVETYVIGDDSWRTLKFNEKNRTADKILYLGEQDGSYRLKEKKACPGYVEYLYDPNLPVYSHGGETLLRSEDKQGSLLQPEPGYRPDVITFLSDELEEEMTISGQICVGLTVRSDAPDTAFAVKISEVIREGKAYNVRTGITTLGYRNHANICQNYVPGEKADIEISLWEIEWRFQKGSRIRLDITSSDFPQYNIHTNQAGPWALQDEVRTANQTIYYGGESCSYVKLPALSREDRK